MAGTFKFELVTPERMVVSEEAAQVVVPGTEGAFTVLPGHAPVISSLRPGVINATLGDGRNVRAFVKGGFAEVDADHLVILAERALNVDKMDASTISEELQAAEAEFSSAAADHERMAASHAIEELKSLRGLV
jgi:F-type H+-transporting ATPase subunit epsilon